MALQLSVEAKTMALQLSVEVKTMTLQLTSPTFETCVFIPAKYTGEGQDVSPSLSWTYAPPETQELALVCEDLDAPTPEPWVHWVDYHIPPSTVELPEDAHENLVQGQNDFGKVGYGGPLPPEGQGVHHYYFHLYALDQPVKAGPGLTKVHLMDLIQSHVLAEGELIGLYERK
jgi:Raf kinase inhibitor-like YbhB/YbcL family protein